MFLPALYSAVCHTCSMLANNQRQGPLNVTDVCGYVRLLRFIHINSNWMHRDVIYTVIMSAPALAFSTAGILEETDLAHNKRKDSLCCSALLRNQQKEI